MISCWFPLKTSYVFWRAWPIHPSIQQTGEFLERQWQQATTRGNRVHKRDVQFMHITVEIKIFIWSPNWGQLTKWLGLLSWTKKKMKAFTFALFKEKYMKIMLEPVDVMLLPLRAIGHLTCSLCWTARVVSRKHRQRAASYWLAPSRAKHADDNRYILICFIVTERLPFVIGRNVIHHVRRRKV